MYLPTIDAHNLIYYHTPLQNVMLQGNKNSSARRMTLFASQISTALDARFSFDLVNALNLFLTFAKCLYLFSC